MEAVPNDNRQFRRLQWRFERVRDDLLGNPRARFRRSDDVYVRSYRRFRLRQNKTGLSEKDQFSLFLAEPYSYLAERLYFSGGSEAQYVLEAHLLTQESFAEIAARLKMEEMTVAYYEALFFSVSDRLNDTESVHDVILGPREYLIGCVDGVLTNGQRGFIYRLFAHYGGPEMLCSVIKVIEQSMMPENRENIIEWLNAAADQIAELWHAAVSENHRLRKDAVVAPMNMVLAIFQAGRIKRVARRRPLRDFERLLARILANLTDSGGPNRDGSKKTRKSSARS